MATTAAQDQLYPFSTEDNKSIPLDIIKPLSIIVLDVSAGALSTFVVPADWKVATFFCEKGCVVEFATANIPATPVSGVEYPTALFVPPNCVVTATVIEGTASVGVLGSGVSKLVIQQVQKWAGMALRRQASSI